MMQPVATDTKYAVEAARRKGAETDWALYLLIDKKPGQSVYSLAKELCWSSGKVYGSVKRLEDHGLIRIDRSERDGRTVLQVWPLEWQDLLSPEELEEFKNLEF